MVVDSIASALCQDFLAITARYQVQMSYIVLDRKEEDKLDSTY